MEARVTNHRAVLTDFEILPEQKIRVAPIGELTTIQRTGRGFLSGEASDGLTGMLNACELEAAKSLLIADAFLLECLSEPENCYEISSYVAMSIFDKLPAISAIAYPSYRQYGALNFAARVERFWDHWGIRAVRCVKANHLSHGYFKQAETKQVFGITSAGGLCWNETADIENSVVLLDPLWTRGP